jgi:hypothetical protein
VRPTAQGGRHGLQALHARQIYGAEQRRAALPLYESVMVRSSRPMHHLKAVKRATTRRPEGSSCLGVSSTAGMIGMTVCGVVASQLTLVALQARVRPPGRLAHVGSSGVRPLLPRAYSVACVQQEPLAGQFLRLVPQEDRHANSSRKVHIGQKNHIAIGGPL